MDKRIKNKWIKALLSGKYKQGKELLRPTDTRFCCLGVLCDIYAKEKKIKWTQNKATGEYTFLKCAGMLPERVVKWAGLEKGNIDAAFDDDKCLYGNLAEVNDDGKQFKTIAGLIKKNF